MFTIAEVLFVSMVSVILTLLVLKEMRKVDHQTARKQWLEKITIGGQVGWDFDQFLSEIWEKVFLLDRTYDPNFRWVNDQVKIQPWVVNLCRDYPMEGPKLLGKLSGKIYSIPGSKMPPEVKVALIRRIADSLSNREEEGSSPLVLVQNLFIQGMKRTAGESLNPKVKEEIFQ